MSMHTLFVASLFIIAGGLALICKTGLFLEFLILCAIGFIIFELGCIIEFLEKLGKSHPHRVKIKCKRKSSYNKFPKKGTVPFLGNFTNNKK